MDRKKFGKVSGFANQDPGLVLVKSKGEIVCAINGSGGERDTYLECTLKEGDYFLFTHMPLNELNKSYNVTCYGIAKCGFEILCKC
jgi:hypothetical protein